MESLNLHTLLSVQTHRWASFKESILEPFSYIQELVVKFPMKGEHKIFKLESNLHNAAKKTAKKGPAVWSFYDSDLHM